MKKLLLIALLLPLFSFSQERFPGFLSIPLLSSKKEAKAIIGKNKSAYVKDEYGSIIECRAVFINYGADVILSFTDNQLSAQKIVVDASTQDGAKAHTKDIVDRFQEKYGVCKISGNTYKWELKDINDRECVVFVTGNLFSTEILSADVELRKAESERLKNSGKEDY